MISVSKKYLFALAMVLMLLLSRSVSGYARDHGPPRVIITYPRNGMRNVDPSIKEISVTFNERMMDKSWSWCYEERDTFPRLAGQPYYTEKNTVNVLPVQLEPN